VFQMIKSSILWFRPQRSSFFRGWRSRGNRPMERNPASFCLLKESPSSHDPVLDRARCKWSRVITDHQRQPRQFCLSLDESSANEGAESSRQSPKHS
jgi:hypothetical protein